MHALPVPSNLEGAIALLEYSGGFKFPPTRSSGRTPSSGVCQKKLTVEKPQRMLDLMPRKTLSIVVSYTLLLLRFLSLSWMIGINIVSYAAVPPTFDWVQKTEASIYGISTDSEGNSFVVGEFYHETELGGIKLEKRFPDPLSIDSFRTDFFWAYLTSNGVVRWAHTAGLGSLNDYCSRVLQDSEGNGYLLVNSETGQTNQTIQLGDISLGLTNLSFSSTYYLLKVSRTGKTLWAKELSILLFQDWGITAQGHVQICAAKCGSSSCSPFSLYDFGPDGDLKWRIDSSGPSGVGGIVAVSSARANEPPDSYITIVTDAAGSIDGVQIPGAGTFLATIQPAGKVLSVKRISNQPVRVRRLVETYDQHLLLMGEFPFNLGTTSTDPLTFGSIALDNIGFNDFFIAKVGFDGVADWAVRGGTPDYDQLYPLGVVSKDSSLWFSFYLASSGVVANRMVDVTVSTNRNFLGKISPSGNLEWALPMLVQGLDIDSFGRAYAATTWAFEPFSKLVGFDLSPAPFSINPANYGGLVSRIGTDAIPPIFLSSLPDQEVSQGSAVTWDINAGGTPPLTYEWRFNGKPIPQATNRYLVIPAVASTNAGAYSVNVCNAQGCSETHAAILKVKRPSVNSVDVEWIQTNSWYNIGVADFEADGDGGAWILTSQSATHYQVGHYSSSGAFLDFFQPSEPLTVGCAGLSRMKHAPNGDVFLNGGFVTFGVWEQCMSRFDKFGKRLWSHEDIGLYTSHGSQGDFASYSYLAIDSAGALHAIRFLSTVQSGVGANTTQVVRFNQTTGDPITEIDLTELAKTSGSNIAMAIDGSDNFILSINYSQNHIALWGLDLPPPIQSGFLLVKLDPQGRLLWYRAGLPALDVSSHWENWLSLDVSKKGTVSLLAAYMSANDWNTGGPLTVACSQFSSEGAPLWATVIGRTPILYSNSESRSVNADAAEGAVVTLTSMQPWDFGDLEPVDRSGDLIVSRFDSKGTLDWQFQVHATTGMVLPTSRGDLFVTGEATRPTLLRGFPIQGPPTRWLAKVFPQPVLTSLKTTSGIDGQRTQLNLQSSLLAPYQIEYTPDFLKWEPLVITTNLTGQFQFEDLVPKEVPHRFYRASIVR